MVRLGYDRAPSLAYWWLDGYVDFDDDQIPRVHAGIDAWMRWHRATQLPDYADRLAVLGRAAPTPITAKAACAWFDGMRRRVDVALDHAVPALAELALTLTPRQIEHIERRYAKGNEAMRTDFLDPDRKRRHDKSVERAIDRFEMLYGRLDDPQRAAVAQRVADSPFDPQRWLDERIAHQREVLATLRRVQAERASLDAAQTAVRRLIARGLTSPRPDYHRYQQQLIDYNCAFFAQVHDLANPVQRRTAAERLASWERDLRTLAADASQ